MNKGLRSKLEIQDLYHKMKDGLKSENSYTRSTYQLRKDE